MPKIQRTLTTTDGIKIYYEFIPNPDKPFLLMNHGNGNCLDDWYTLGYVDLLKDDFQIIMVDARGFGKSDKPLEPEAYTEDKISGDFIAVLNVLGVDKCHYFGNSRGGSMGFIFAALHSERFCSFCLCSAQPYGSAGPRLSISFTEWLTKGIEVFVDKLEATLGKPFPEGIRKTFLKNNPTAMLAANHLAWTDYSSAFYHSGAPPCLLIVGEKDSVADSNRTFVARAIELHNTEIQLKILEGMSHADIYWRSDVVGPLLKEFHCTARHAHTVTASL